MVQVVCSVVRNRKARVMDGQQGRLRALRAKKIMRKCPTCYGTKSHSSQRRWYEWPLACLLMGPFRCHNCCSRYLSFRVF